MTIDLYESSGISIVQKICEWYDDNDNDHPDFEENCDYLNDIEPNFKVYSKCLSEVEWLVDKLSDAKAKLRDADNILDKSVKKAIAGFRD